MKNVTEKDIITYRVVKQRNLLKINPDSVDDIVVSYFPRKIGKDPASLSESFETTIKGAANCIVDYHNSFWLGKYISIDNNTKPIYDPAFKFHIEPIDKKEMKDLWKYIEKRSWDLQW